MKTVSFTLYEIVSIIASYARRGRVECSNMSMKKGYNQSVIEPFVITEG